MATDSPLGGKDIGGTSVLDLPQLKAIAKAVSIRCPHSGRTTLPSLSLFPPLPLSFRSRFTLVSGAASGSLWVRVPPVVQQC